MSCQTILPNPYDLGTLGNIRKIPKLHGDTTLSPAYPAKILAIALKKYLKTDIKIFWFKCLPLLDFLTFLEIFGTGLYILENAKKSKNENSDYQIFHKSCSSCMFSTKKNLR